LEVGAVVVLPAGELAVWASQVPTLSLHPKQQTFGLSAFFHTYRTLYTLEFLQSM
jgi:hypothetical protein